MSITPYWFQTEAVNAIYNYFANGKRGNPVIALPTGTGKSVVIASFIESVLRRYPHQRVLMVTHVKELIQQNCKRMLDVWPNAPVGIHSAGLKQRDTVHPIIFGGIASMYKKVETFGHRDILIIDEAHLLSPNKEAMYQVFINGLKKTNPNLIVIGLTATAYRLGQGALTDDGIFTDIIYDLTDIKGFNRLIAEGFLSPIYPKKTETEYDLSGVSLVSGEYAVGELEKRVNASDKLTLKILKELVYHGTDRNHWLLFASGIEHAERIATMLRDEFNITAVAIHSKIPSAERDKRISDFVNGRIRCAVNNNVLTTGFDFPAIDLIGHLRPTMSPGLWVQMNGRGTRPSAATGKRDCIALDFAGNTRRLGPINDPVKPQAKGKSKGDAPVRICPECGTYCAASAAACYCCGHTFTFAEKLAHTASTDELIRTDEPIIETFEVARVNYSRHMPKRQDAKPCIRVQYLCKNSLRAFSEWVHLDAGGAAGHRARDWWRMRSKFDPPTPETVKPHFESATDAALKHVSQLRAPRALRVWLNTAYPEVQSVEF